MSQLGSFDFSEFAEFAKKLEKGIKEQNFIYDFMDQLGNILLSEVKENTPVGQYDKFVSFMATNKKGEKVQVSFETSGARQGGHLRRNWFLESVSKSGDAYTVTIYNNVEYGIWVEEGHRIVRNGQEIGWVEGQFFMKLTVDEIKDQLPKLVGPAYKDYLKRLGF